jgi:hypothetical protein
MNSVITTMGRIADTLSRLLQISEMKTKDKLNRSINEDYMHLAYVLKSMLSKFFKSTIIQNRNNENDFNYNNDLEFHVLNIAKMVKEGHHNVSSNYISSFFRE